MLFKRKKKQTLESVAEQRFDQMMELIKDLPRADYKRLCEAMSMAYEAYQKVKNVKTIDEKELEDIEGIDKSLVKESD